MTQIPPSKLGATGGKSGGLPVVAWIAIGCGSLLVLGLAVFVVGGWMLANKARDLVENPREAAELLVRLNPELELVDSDDEAGTVTIRNRSSGEIVTVDFEDLKEGRLRFETAEGEMSLSLQGEEGGGRSLTVKTEEGEARFGAGSGHGGMPDWVPLYPGASEPEASFTATADDEQQGAFSIETDASIDDVATFYRRELEAAGYEVRTQSLDLGGDAGRQATVLGENTGENRTLTVTAVSTEEGSQVIVQYRGSG